MCNVPVYTLDGATSSKNTVVTSKEGKGEDISMFTTDAVFKSAV